MGWVAAARGISSSWRLKVDIDNDTNAKIINVVAGLLDSRGIGSSKKRPGRKRESKKCGRNIERHREENEDEQNN